MTRRAIALLVIAGGLLANCAREGTKPTNPASPHPSAQARAATSAPIAMSVTAKAHGKALPTFTFFKDKRRVYQLRAVQNDFVRSADGNGRSTFVQPTISFFGRDGGSMVAVAPRGIALEREKTVELMGRVHAHTNDGKTIDADTLVYHRTSERITADGNVIITAPGGEQMTGPHVEANLTLSELHMGAPGEKH